MSNRDHRPRNAGHDSVKTGRIIDALQNTPNQQLVGELPAPEHYHALYDMLRSMCDNIPDLIWAKDIRKRYLYANPAMCEKLLIANHPDEVIGKTDMFFAERQRARYPERTDWHTFGEICGDTDDVVIASRAPGRFDEYGNVCGELLCLDVYKAPFFSTTGEVIGTVGCGRDVTSEKLTKESYRESVRSLSELAEQYQTIINASSDGFWLFDESGAILDVNDAYCRMSGFPRDEIIGMSIADLEVLPSAVDIGRRLREFREQVSERFETLHRTKTGKLLEVEASVIFNDLSGRYVAFLRDITPRRIIQRALAESESRYKKLLYSVTDYIYSVQIVNGRAVKTEHGPGCIAVTGYEPQEFERNPDLWITMVHEDDRSMVGDHAGRILSGADAVSLEHRIIRKDGAVRWVSNLPVLWRDAAGQLIAYDGLISDITERKIAEQALRFSEERSRSIIDMSPEGIVIHRDGMILFVNPAAARYVGYSPEQLKGRSVAEFIHPDYHGRMMQRLGMLRKTGDVTPLAHYRTIRFDGSLSDGEITSTMIEYDGAPAILSMMRDVSERMSAESAVRDSERRLSTLLETSPDIITRCNRELQCTYMSPAIERYTGCKPEVYLGSTCAGAGLPPDLCRVIEDSLKQVFASSVAGEIEFEYGTLRTRRLTFNCRHLPEFGADGQVKSVLSILRDITEHRSLERDYRMLFQSMVEGFALHEIILDKGEPVDYRFLAVNPSFERMTGLRAADVVGRTVREVLPGSESHWVERYGRVALTGDTDSFEAFSTPLGKWFEVNVYRPATGQFACTFVDISHRKLAELEQKRLEEQLRQSQKMEAIGILAGGVAHDFNNIIQAIVGNAYLLKRRSRHDAESQMFVDEMIQLSNRAADLTRGLLAFSRKQFLSPQAVDLNETVRAGARMLSRIIGEDVTLDVVFVEHPLVVEIDPGQIQQVIMNLTTNARDAMPHGGCLRIETGLQTRLFAENDGTERCYACISMKDTGCGIRAGDLPHIFEPFFTTKEVGKGTGLGLSVVYGIVKQHQGYVEVESVPGEGTEFRVLIPLLLTSGVHHSPEKAVEDTGGSETILLIEDDAGVRRSTRRLLESVGYTVLETPDGAEGVETFRQNRTAVSLVITDVVMPGMNGKEVSEKLLEIDPSVRIIFVSGYPEEALSRKSLDVIEYINKPIMPEDLLVKVRRMIDAEDPVGT